MAKWTQRKIATHVQDKDNDTTPATANHNNRTKSFERWNPIHRRSNQTRSSGGNATKNRRRKITNRRLHPRRLQTSATSVSPTVNETLSSSPSNETHTFPRNQENDRHCQPAILGRKSQRQTNSLLSYFRTTTTTTLPFATAAIAPDASAPPPPHPMRTAILSTYYYCDRW